MPPKKDKTASVQGTTPVTVEKGSNKVYVGSNDTFVPVGPIDAFTLDTRGEVVPIEDNFFYKCPIQIGSRKMVTSISPFIVKDNKGKPIIDKDNCVVVIVSSKGGEIKELDKENYPSKGKFPKFKSFIPSDTPKYMKFELMDEPKVSK